MKNFHFSRLLAGSVLVFAFAVALSSSLQAKQGHGGDGAPFTGIYAFGDSLTDTGNFFAMTGSPPPPYFEGRVSNGIIWIEYLTNAMGLDDESVVNYAVAGATTGRDNENDVPGFEFPGLQDEIDLFKDDLNGKKADKRALYVVWAGANDFFVATGSPEETIATGVRNTKRAIRRLHRLGARRVMVVNLPDLGMTPYGSQLSGNALGLSYVSALYNASLDSALDQLECRGIETIRVDASGVLHDVVANPEEFGFSNVTDAYLRPPAGGYPTGDPAEFLFWDNVHPTTHGHFWIGEEAMSVLQREFRHAWGTPRNRR